MDGVAAPLVETLAAYLKKRKADPNGERPETTKKLQILVEQLADLVDPDGGTDARDVERDLWDLLRGQLAVLRGEGDTNSLKAYQRESLDDLNTETYALASLLMLKVTDELARRARVAAVQQEQRSNAKDTLAARRKPRELAPA